MNKKILSTLFCLIALTALCSCQPKNQTTNGIIVRSPQEKLYDRMDTLRNHGAMYGHQDDPFYGITWSWDQDRSDTKELVGDYPAIMGFELGGIELGNPCNLDSVPFDWMRKEIIKHYQRGGIITISWHPRNPRTGGDTWDVSDTTVVRNILPGGEQHELFVDWMQKLATFLKTLKLQDGRSVPFILRPWHEYNGSWFWWGEKLCTPEQYKALWCMFQDYINEQLPTNIIWSFSPNLQGNWTEEAFMQRYPGNERVTLLGCDAYQWGSEKDFIAGLSADLAFLNDFAQKNNLLFAMTECGMQNSPTPDWWSRVFLPLIQDYPVCYFLPWRNWHKEHFGASKDASTAEDFKQLYENHQFQLLQDIVPTGIMSGRDSSEIIWL